MADDASKPVRTEYNSKLDKRVVSDADLDARIDARIAAGVREGMDARLRELADALRMNFRPGSPRPDQIEYLCAVIYTLRPAPREPATRGGGDDDGSHAGDPGDFEEVPTPAQTHAAWVAAGKPAPYSTRAPLTEPSTPPPGAPMGEREGAPDLLRDVPAIKVVHVDEAAQWVRDARAAAFAAAVAACGQNIAEKRNQCGDTQLRIWLNSILEEFRALTPSPAPDALLPGLLASRDKWRELNQRRTTIGNDAYDFTRWLADEIARLSPPAPSEDGR